MRAQVTREYEFMRNKDFLSIVPVTPEANGDYKGNCELWWQWALKGDNSDRRKVTATEAEW